MLGSQLKLSLIISIVKAIKNISSISQLFNFKFSLILQLY